MLGNVRRRSEKRQGTSGNTRKCQKTTELLGERQKNTRKHQELLENTRRIPENSRKLQNNARSCQKNDRRTSKEFQEISGNIRNFWRTSEKRQENVREHQKNFRNCQKNDRSSWRIPEELQELQEIPENSRKRQKNTRKLQKKVRRTTAPVRKQQNLLKNTRNCQETSGLPEEIGVGVEEVSDPIGDSGPEPGELLIIPRDLDVDALPWGLWVRGSGAGCFETAKHYDKQVYFCGDDGIVAPICNLDLAYKLKNLSDNPNLLNSYPEAYDELRADLGVSYFFENKNETSE